MRVYRLPMNGDWIDLDHVLTISPAYFDDRMGSGGYFVGFNIEFMFRNEPVRYLYEGQGIEPDYNSKAKLELKKKFGADYPERPEEFAYASREHGEWAEVHVTAWLQRRVDDLIKAWRQSP